MDMMVQRLLLLLILSICDGSSSTKELRGTLRSVRVKRFIAMQNRAIANIAGAVLNSLPPGIISPEFREPSRNFPGAQSSPIGRPTTPSMLHTRSSSLTSVTRSTAGAPTAARSVSAADATPTVATVRPATVRPATVSHATVQPATDRPATVTPATVSPATVGHATVRLPTVRSSTVRPVPSVPAVTLAVTPSVGHTMITTTATVVPEFRPPPNDFPGVQPSTAGRATTPPLLQARPTVRPFTARPATIRPATVRRATISPATVSPTTITPATVSPSTITPSTVRPPPPNALGCVGNFSSSAVPTSAHRQKLLQSYIR